VDVRGRPDPSRKKDSTTTDASSHRISIRSCRRVGTASKLINPFSSLLERQNTHHDVSINTTFQYGILGICGDEIFRAADTCDTKEWFTTTITIIIGAIIIC
jgi:hypothetical protein